MAMNLLNNRWLPLLLLLPVLALSIAAQPLSPAAATPPVGSTTAEKLGYAPTERLLMVHADDIGMSHSVNVATIEALKKGLVTSGSIMVPCPWFPEIAEHFRQNPTLDLGLHLTLTSEWKYLRWRPVASVDRVPGLLDPDGYLWRSEIQVAMKATPKEVETELRAQIDKALAAGLRPTHLDTHMGTLYTRKDFFEVYTRLGREYGIPVMAMRPTPEAVAYGRKSRSPIGADELTRLETEGYVLLDYLETGVPGRNFAERKESYKTFLRNLKPGVTMLIVHLGMDDPELKAATAAWEARYADYLSFTDPEISALIKELGIRLTTWRELGRIAWKK